MLPQAVFGRVEQALQCGYLQPVLARLAAGVAKDVVDLGAPAGVQVLAHGGTVGGGAANDVVHQWGKVFCHALQV